MLPSSISNSPMNFYSIDNNRSLNKLVYDVTNSVIYQILHLHINIEIIVEIDIALKT